MFSTISNPVWATSFLSPSVNRCKIQKNSILLFNCNVYYKKIHTLLQSKLKKKNYENKNKTCFKNFQTSPILCRVTWYALRHRHDRGQTPTGTWKGWHDLRAVLDVHPRSSELSLIFSTRLLLCEPINENNLSDHYSIFCSFIY